MSSLPEDDGDWIQPAARTLSSACVDGRVAIRRTKGFAVTPWAMTLSNTVQPAASMMVSLPGSFSSRTRTAKTIVANPRGPN
jgi:hypothetical protein